MNNSDTRINRDFKSSYFISRYLYLRLIGLSFLFAFSSLYIQLDGLYGRDGIMPVYKMVAQGKSRYDMNFLLANAPSLFWFADGAESVDNYMHYACVAGMALSFLSVLGLCHAFVYAALYILYLSFVHVGQTFLSFQWDILILEGSFIAIFVAPLLSVKTLSRSEPSPWISFFMNKLLTGSGLVKLNESWTNLSAMDYHYETTCIPNPLSWYFHQLPASFHKGEVILTFAIEIFMTPMVFGERLPRIFGTLAQVALQLAIASTGNYTFFNFLSIAFLILVMDDDFWLSYVFPKKLGTYFVKALGPVKNKHTFSAWVILLWIKSALYTSLLAFIFVASISPFFSRHIKHESVPQFVSDAYSVTQPYMITNSYGLFASMTKVRDEIIIQGSNNSVDWLTYEFKFKPGDIYRAPPIVAPHQPRLDWQMWFAALSEAKKQPWFLQFVKKLLEGSAPVTALLEQNPFPSKPPKYIRALRYRYKYTNFTSCQKKNGSAWWNRKQVGTYLDPVVVEQLANF